MNPIERRTCKRCGTTAVGRDEIEAAFAVSHKFRQHTDGKYRETVCNVCRIEMRTSKKERDRFVVKAENTTSKHAKKFGLAVSILRSELGWNRLAADMRSAYQQCCPECNHPYQSLDDLTIDISNPERDPFYPENASLMCRTCNTSKAKTPRHLYDARKRFDRKWQQRKAERDAMPHYEQAPLWGPL
jgi:hypothetical protein